jgi:hypothetical protein
MNSSFSICRRSCLFIVLITGSLFGQRVIGPPSASTGLLLSDDITRALIQHSSGDLAYDDVVRLALWDRSQVTAGYAEAAQWISGKARQIGLDSVQIESFPSGNSVQYFGNETERLWKVGKGELWLTAPFEVRLTTYEELPMSLARNSVTADVEGDVVDVGGGTRDEDYRTDVRGKIVLTESSPGSVWSQAVVKRGAVGIVSSWSVPSFDFLNRLPGDQPDEVGWGRIPEPHQGDTSRPAFLISSRRAQELKQLLSQGKKLRMRMIVDGSLSDGTLDVVSAVIPGTAYPAEEIILTAHLDHYKPGANDNASGAATVLEMARTFSALVAAGTLPKPLRTIRFLWVPEYMGTWAWLSRHQADAGTRVANLNFDMVGEDLKKTNARFAIGYTPDFNPSWMNGLMESILDFLNKYNDDRFPLQKDFHVISVRGSRNRLQAVMELASVGTDHELFNNLGTPATGPAAWPDDFYHSSEDTPDKTDPTQLHRVVVMGLAALATIAYADDPAALLLARQALERGRLRIAGSEFEAAQIVATTSAEGFGPAVRRARAVIQHVYSRERAAIQSAVFFARTGQTSRGVQSLAKLLDEEEQNSLGRMEERIASRARDLGVKVPSSAMTEADRKLARIVPVRVKGKELVSVNVAMGSVMADTTLRVRELAQTLTAALQQMRSQGVSELRLMGAVEAIAHYADGSRNLQEIREEYGAEYTMLSPETVEQLFRGLEKAGVMELRQ